MNAAPTFKPQPVYVGDDVYLHADEFDGLYERDITCAECATSIGVYSLDESWEIFVPYWMCDEDNNYNLCRGCHSVVYAA